MVKKSTILEVSDQRFWESLRIIPERSDLTPGGLGGDTPKIQGGSGGGEAPPGFFKGPKGPKGPLGHGKTKEGGQSQEKEGGKAS